MWTLSHLRGYRIRLKKIFSYCRKEISFKQFKETIARLSITGSYYTFLWKDQIEWVTPLFLAIYFYPSIFIQEQTILVKGGVFMIRAWRTMYLFFRFSCLMVNVISLLYLDFVIKMYNICYCLSMHYFHIYPIDESRHDYK